MQGAERRIAMEIKAFELIAPNGKIVARFESDCTGFEFMMELAENLVSSTYKDCTVKYY